MERKKIYYIAAGVLLVMALIFVFLFWQNRTSRPADEATQTDAVTTGSANNGTTEPQTEEVSGENSYVRPQGTYFEVQTDGSVLWSFEEDFDLEIYDLEECRQEVAQEIAACNQEAGGDAMKLISMSEAEGVLTTVFSFRDADTLTEYCNTYNRPEEPFVFFYGTVAEALAAGFSLEENYDSQTAEVSYLTEDLKQDASVTVLITNGAGQLQSRQGSLICFGGSAALSDGIVRGTGEANSLVFFQSESQEPQEEVQPEAPQTES